MLYLFYFTEGVWYDMGVLTESLERLLNFYMRLCDNDWVLWTAQPNDWNDDCDKFDGCFFIVKSMPRYPQHANCRCLLKKIDKPIPYKTANADCDVRKFSEYIFAESQSNGKKALFENWGYSKKDSELLKDFFISQALKKYCAGDYKFSGTNDFCAKIEIIIELPVKNGKIRSIKSGWCLLKNGELKLSTPFSGFAAKED